MKEAINLLRPPLRFHNQQRGVANPLQYETITLCDGDEDDSDERKPAAGSSSSMSSSHPAGGAALKKPPPVSEHVSTNSQNTDVVVLLPDDDDNEEVDDRKQAAKPMSLQTGSLRKPPPPRYDDDGMCYCFDVVDLYDDDVKDGMTDDQDVARRLQALEWSVDPRKFLSRSTSNVAASSSSIDGQRSRSLEHALLQHDSDFMLAQLLRTEESVSAGANSRKRRREFTPDVIELYDEDDNNDATERLNADGTECVQGEEESNHKKVSDWPMKNITEPHDHDVLYGRGGGTNHHPGNKRYRKMVEDRKLDYVNSKRLDKPLVALEIIKVWRGQNPPGRFLKLDEKTGMWNDVGDKKAREKTSQALREKAPLIRKQQEEERCAHDNDEDDQDNIKSTRFAEGTKNESGNMKKPAIAARNTSLGPLAADNQALVGFSWQDGIGDDEDKEKPGASNTSVPPTNYPQSQYPPHPGAATLLPPGNYRYSSHGSVGSSGPPPYPPPGPYVPTASDDRRMQFASQSGRFDSWSSLPQHAAPPPPMPSAHIHSGHMQSGGSWGVPDHGMVREHSLGGYPLPAASIGRPAPYPPFVDRSGSGHFAPPYPPPHYGPPPYHYSSGVSPPPPPSPGGYGPPPHMYRGHSRTHSNTALSIDPAVASAWAGKPQSEIEKTLSGEIDSADKSSSPSRFGLVCTKPEIIKRATSNQNETPDTKPDRVGVSVKRAALNRDSSRAANRLKEISFPGQFSNGKFDAALEVRELSRDMGRSTLNGDFPEPSCLSDDDRKTTLDFLQEIDDEATPKPQPIAKDGRTPSVDLVAMDLATKPKPIGTTGRATSATIEGLALDAVDDLLRPEMVRVTTAEVVMADLERPGVIGVDDRLTTSDFIAMVNAPIADDDPSMFTGRQEV